MHEITAEAASNIALIKYWGAVDLETAMPQNPSVSMTLSACRSICSATFFAGEVGPDEVLLEQGGVLAPAEPSFRARVDAHLDRLRQAFGHTGRFRIATKNTFPHAAGIASSASGFTALSLAVLRAMGESPSTQELSTWSRRSGSGSAARSAYGGFVQWPHGDSEESGYAFQLATENDWQFCDLVVILSSGPKSVSSRDGHRRAASSPYYERRQELLPQRLEVVRRAIEERDFEAMMETVEEEGIDLHLIAMSSRPPIFYWQPPTLAVLDRVRSLRREGVPVCSTMDAGANVHVLCKPQDAASIEAELAKIEGVERIIVDRTGGAPVWREGAEL